MAAALSIGFIKIARVGDLESGTMRPLTVGGRDILLAGVRERYFAADNSCPHRGEKLTNGKLTGAAHVAAVP